MLFGPEQSLALGGTLEYGVATDGVNGWVAWLLGTSVVVRKSTNQFYDLASASNVTVDTNSANSNVVLNEQFVVDPVTGRLHLFWARNEGNGGAPCALVTSHSDNQGATWSTPVVVDSGATYGNNRFFRVGVGAFSGVIGIAYASISSSAFTTQSGGGPLFVQSTDGGATWSTPVTLYASVATTGEPNVSIGEDGTIRTTWYDSGVNTNAGGDIYYAAAPWSASGYVWQSAPTRVTTGQTCGRVRHWTSNGVVIATANTNWGGAVADVGTVRSTDGGLTWGSVVTQATHGAGPLTHPWVDFQSNIGGLIWYDTSNNPSPGVYGFKTTADAGATWATGTPMTTTLATADAPKIVITNDLLWTFGMDASGNLIFAPLPLFSPAVPSTSVIDAFTRANENPLSNGGTWSQEAVAGSSQLKLVSDEVTLQAGGGTFGRSGSYRNDTSIAEGEAYFTIANNGGADGEFDLFLISQPGKSGYDVNPKNNFGSTSIQFTRLDAGTGTTLAFTTAFGAVTGDKYLLRLTPNDVVAYRFVSASGDWMELFRERDTTYRSAVPPALDITAINGNPFADDFGGGALVAPSNSVAPVASGIVGAGRVLSVNEGTWATASGATPARYKYQWQSSPAGANTWSDVPLAALPFFTVSDQSKDYHVIVTASNSYGTTPATSNVLRWTPAPGSGVHIIRHERQRKARAEQQRRVAARHVIFVAANVPISGATAIANLGLSLGANGTAQARPHGVAIEMLQLGLSGAATVHPHAIGNLPISLGIASTARAKAQATASLLFSLGVSGTGVAGPTESSIASGSLALALGLQGTAFVHVHASAPALQLALGLNGTGMVTGAIPVRTRTFARIPDDATFPSLTSDRSHTMPQTIERIVGETSRPLIGTFGSMDGTLPASLPPGSTITLSGIRTDNNVVVFSGREVTITDWPTLAFTCTLLAAPDLATACTMRLRFIGVPPGGGGPVAIPDDDRRFGLYLSVTQP